MSITRGALPQDNFTLVSNEWMRDDRLSWKARGLLAYLLSHSVGWNVTERNITEAGPDGRDSVRTGLAELETTGYLTRYLKRAPDGRVLGTHYVVGTPTDEDHDFADKPMSDNPTSGKRTLDNPTTKREKTISQKTISQKTDPFDTWWDTYPRKAGKGAARTAYAKAAKKVDTSLLLAGALRYSKDPNREPSFTAHPATWLNGERWEDDPLPARSEKDASGGTTATPDAVTVFLRQMWQEGRAKAVADRSGLRYPQPDVPEEITTGAGAWVKQQARDWIAAHHDEALAAIMSKDAA